jgi:predicted dehydrogenase
VTLRVVTLGAGYFARFHHDGWRRIDGVEHAGVADGDPATGAAHRDLAELLALEPDIVDIATPPPSHAPAIRAALAARPRAVICQKPFCTSPEEARAVTGAAEDAGVPLIVHENFRFQPWWRAAPWAGCRPSRTASAPATAGGRTRTAPASPTSSACRAS